LDYFELLEKKYYPNYREKSRRAASAKKGIMDIEAQRKLNPGIEGYTFSVEYNEKLKEWAVGHLKGNYILMVWKHQHRRWNYAELPLFFDIGDEFVYQCIENIKIWNGFIVKKYSKKNFVNYYKNRQKNAAQHHI